MDDCEGMGLQGRQETLNANVGVLYVCTYMLLCTAAGNEQNIKKNKLWCYHAQ